MNFATQEEPLGTPHERIGVPKGPQNAIKWCKRGNLDIIIEKQEKVCLQPLIWFDWLSVSHGGKLGPMAKYYGCVRGLEGTKNDPKWVKIKGFKKKEKNYLKSG